MSSTDRRARASEPSRNVESDSIAAVDEELHDATYAPLAVARQMTVIVQMSDRAAAPSESLTPQQRRCIDLAGEGLTSKEIARVVELSPNTVDYHIKNAMRILGVSTRVDAVKAISRSETTTLASDLPTRGSSLGALHQNLRNGSTDFLRRCFRIVAALAIALYALAFFDILGPSMVKALFNLLGLRAKGITS